MRIEGDLHGRFPARVNRPEAILVDSHRDPSRSCSTKAKTHKRSKPCKGSADTLPRHSASCNVRLCWPCRASHRTRFDGLRRHSPHFLHKQLTISAERQLLQEARFPEAFTSLCRDAAVHVDPTDAMNLGALQLFFKAICCDVILEVHISSLPADHIRLRSC